MSQFRRIESAIYQELKRHGPCAPEELIDRLPDYSWSQVFAAIDRLTRGGRLTIRHPSRFRCLVSISATVLQEEA